MRQAPCRLSYGRRVRRRPAGRGLALERAPRLKHLPLRRLRPLRLRRPGICGELHHECSCYPPYELSRRQSPKSYAFFASRGRVGNGAKTVAAVGQERRAPLPTRLRTCRTHILGNLRRVAKSARTDGGDCWTFTVCALLPTIYAIHTPAAPPSARGSCAPSRLPLGCS